MPDFDAVALAVRLAAEEPVGDPFAEGVLVPLCDVDDDAAPRAEGNAEREGKAEVVGPPVRVLVEEVV